MYTMAHCGRPAPAAAVDSAARAAAATFKWSCGSAGAHLRPSGIAVLRALASSGRADTAPPGGPYALRLAGGRGPRCPALPILILLISPLRLLLVVQHVLRLQHAICRGWDAPSGLEPAYCTAWG